MSDDERAAKHEERKALAKRESKELSAAAEAKAVRSVANRAAAKYHRLADVIVDSISDEEVRAAARMTSKEAPMFMHMVKSFMDAQVKTNARAEESKRGINVNIGSVNLPHRRQVDESQVIDVEAEDVKK